MAAGQLGYSAKRDIITTRKIGLRREFKYLVPEDTAKLLIMVHLQPTSSVGF